MKRTPVQSSNIASIGYDQESQTLEIEFHNGRVYQYFDVPHGQHSAMMSAGSHGSYFHDNIKGYYRYARV